MRIDKVNFKKYRQFENNEISFTKKTDKNDLHLIVGVMGTGKTNFLNGINWCLYGDEPLLSLQSIDENVPRLNLLSVENNVGEKTDFAEIEILAQSDSKNFLFKRKQLFKLVDKKYNASNSSLSVRISDEPIYEDDEAKNRVDRFVPFGIREFFFFDGERLDNFFKKATAQNIQHAIETISQTTILERIVEKLEKLLTIFRREAGALNPEIDKIRTELETTQKELKENKDDYDKCKKQIETAKEEADKYKELLRKVPQIADYVDRITFLKLKINEKEKKREDKLKDRNEILVEHGKIIMTYPAIMNTMKIINAKREKKELPPLIDKKLIEGILESKERLCICKREVNKSSTEEKVLEGLLEKISLSTEEALELTRIESSLDQMLQKKLVFRKLLSNNNVELKDLDKELSDYMQELESLKNKIKGYSSDQINDWSRRLKVNEEIYENNQKRLWSLESRSKELQSEEKKLTNDLDKAIKKAGRATEIREKIKFTEKGLLVISQSIEDIKRKMKDKIEDQTSSGFLALHWKEKTFKCVRIKDDYAITPILNSGYDGLNILSGGEREILALAFTLSLHDITGFQSPIIIDRPFAMASGEPVEYIAEAFKIISNHRQVILMLAPKDYTDEVKNILDNAASNRYRFSLQTNERALNLEVI